jgi:hypothetical protein
VQKTSGSWLNNIIINGIFTDEVLWPASVWIHLPKLCMLVFYMFGGIPCTGDQPVPRSVPIQNKKQKETYTVP